VDECMKQWDVANLKPDFLPAQAAQKKLLAYYTRLGKIVARQLREAKRSIPQEEAEDRYERLARNGAVPAK
jgi:acetyl-CoA carboxylase alpha subunit